jgi:hypothetical protein
LGTVKDGVVEVPNPDSYEDAPPQVAKKLPAPLKGKVRPDVLAKVLKADATWRFLDELYALAYHLDVLSGQPTKFDIYKAEFKEQAGHVAEQVGGAVVDAMETAADLPGKVAGAGKDLLKWGALAALGLGVLLVVTR